MIRSAVASVLIAVLCAFSTPASAGPYDLIIANSIDLTLCQGCGITLAGLDYGLIVNTGTSNITLADLTGATFSVSASRSEVDLYPFINIPNPVIVGAIHPNEAMGSIIPQNSLLLPFIRPGETLRNLQGLQFMAYMVDRSFNTYEGPIDYDVTMRMAGYEARYRIHADVHLGPHAIRFLTATRLSATVGNQPPVCSAATVEPAQLWPPSGGLVPVAIAGVTDPDGDPVSITVTGITQDEPVSGPSGRAATGRCGDGVIVDGAAEVRAQRDGGGNGRVYRISFAARDGRGGECQGNVSVSVPPSPHRAALDDGQLFDSGCSAGGRALAFDAQPLRIEAATAGGRTLEYTLGSAASVSVELFDVAGRRVAAIEDGAKSAGRHEVRWDAAVPRGVYFLRVKAGEQVLSRRLYLASQ